MTQPITLTDGDVLIAVDPQNDFCPEGALAVPQGDQVVPLLNRLGQGFDRVVLTQDWHPWDHTSFASAHRGCKPYESIDVFYGAQTLWPDHCVQGTKGAEFHWDLALHKAQMIIRKGCDRQIDSYSAFYENDHKTPTGLTGYLRSLGQNRVFLAGLATDFCVYYSAMDALREGFKVVVIEDACRAIDLEGSLDAAMSEMTAAGVAFITSDAILG
ncbi:MAG: bifunctional nicotinamidase/pyrazinamidase [Pseudomonadota bacterium]